MTEGTQIKEIIEIVEGKEIVFRALGSSVILSATQKVRDIKMRPCRDMMSSLSGSSLDVIVGQVNAAIEAVMRHMIPDRSDIFEWLQVDEGTLFMMEESLKKTAIKGQMLDVTDVFDRMDLDQIDRVRNFLVHSIARRPETDKATKELLEQIRLQQAKEQEVAANAAVGETPVAAAE